MNYKRAAANRLVPVRPAIISRRRACGLLAGVVASPLIALLSDACGHGHVATNAPHIEALKSTSAHGAPGGPVDIHGTVVDSSSGQPIVDAHISYDTQVLTTDTTGSYAFRSVRPGQRLYVVAPGYGRFVTQGKPIPAQIKMAPFEVRALYMPYTGMSDPKILATIEKYTTDTEVNAVVLEVKTDDGMIPSALSTPAAEAAHAVFQDGNLLTDFLQKMHDRGLYMIGRFVCFRDPTLATAHPDWALRRIADGKIYEDEQGQKWMDAFRQENRQYNVDIAVKAAQTGFDEIQFDYVRFPGAISPLAYAEPMTQENRVAAIGGFLKQAEEQLRKYGVALGVDTFGLTTIATDDTGIGQDIMTLGRYIDFYCPMVYPSTWSDGSLGIGYPPADPYGVVLASVQSAVKRLAEIPTVRVRPWLQAFDDYKAQRLDYTPDRVNIQKVAEKKAGGVGWMLWHPITHYDAGAIGPKAPAAGQ